MKKILTVSIIILCLMINAALALEATVLGTTATQAVLSYQAPTNEPCRIEVSENPSYNPLVHDVDQTIFLNANSDQKTSSLFNNKTRIVVIGQRRTERGLDGLLYSRALQTNTQHYYRITCSPEIATGTFTTMNIPLGMTYSDVPQTDPEKPGEYLWPTMIETRENTIVDPYTGVLTKPFLLWNDSISDRGEVAYGGGTSGGMHTLCSWGKSANGFYHCFLPLINGGPYLLYGIKPADSEIRFYGVLYERSAAAGAETGLFYCYPSWDQTDPNVFYCTAQDQSTKENLVLKGTYTGNDVNVIPQQALPGDVSGPKVQAQYQQITPSGNDLNKILSASAGRFGYNEFNISKYGCGISAVQNNYLIIGCRRSIQDTFSYHAVIDLGNKKTIGNGWVGTNGNTEPVIAFTSLFDKPASRWCTFHTFGGGQDNVVELSVQTPSGYGNFAGSGPYTVTLQTNLEANMQRVNITVSSSWDSSWGEIPAGWENGEPVSPFEDHFLMKVQVGDVFYFPSGGGEYIRIVQKYSSTKWEIERGVNYYGRPSYFGDPKQHSIGDQLRANCNQPMSDYTIKEGGILGSIYWDFIASPDGRDPNNFVGQTVTVGHASNWGNYRVDSTWSYIPNPITDKQSWWSHTKYNISTNPKFSGAIGPADGLTYQKHPSNNQVMASPLEQEWFLDHLPFTGGNIVSGAEGQAAKRIDQDLIQYFYETGIDGGKYGDGLNRKQLATIAVSSNNILSDISGPNSYISGSSEYAFKYCIAYKDGECRPGSVAGNIFANAPGVSFLACSGGEAYSGKKDICIADFAMMGIAVTQFGMKNENDVDGKYRRVLSRVYSGYRDLSGYANAKLLPDGSWAWFGRPLLNGTKRISERATLIKIPPWPASDGIKRNTFIPATVNIETPQNQGIAGAIIAFGYLEQGSPTDYYCTSRREACIANTNTIDESNPFQYEQTDNYQPMPCTNNCQITIPLIPQRVTYFQIKYTNDKGQVALLGKSGIASEKFTITAGNQMTQINNTKKAGDINSDGEVNIEDIQELLKDFGKTSDYNPLADQKTDKNINLLDIIIIIRNWM